MFTRARAILLASVACLALLVGGGIVVAQSGNAASSAAVSATAPRGWYIDAHGLPHFLPKLANAFPGHSGDYAGMWYFGDTLATAAGVPGPAGPQGPKGDPGNNNVTSKHATAHLTSASSGTVTVTVTGLPAWHAGIAEASVNNYAARPVASDFTVTAVPPANGDTSRVFHLTAFSGFGSNAFDFDVQVITIT